MLRGLGSKIGSVRCYVTLGMGASQRDARKCLQCHIIPSEALALGKSGMA